MNSLRPGPEGDAKSLDIRANGKCIKPQLQLAHHSRANLRSTPGESVTPFLPLVAKNTN
jgi:hypothetical protein